MITKDILGRRNRYASVSTRKRVTLKERDIRWLRAIRDHGILSSDMLHAFTACEWGDAKSARVRLADLFHEENTSHGGAYLVRPQAQRARANALNVPLVYDLTDAAWAALCIRKDACIRPSGPFAHQLMVSTFTAAIELACASIGGLRFIPGWQILQRGKARLDVNLRVTVPPEVEPQARRLVPDQLFALEYDTVDGKRYLSFAVECDRGTEPLTSSDAARKNALRNYLQYRCLIGEGVYKSHYGLTCNMVALNVFHTTRRMEAHMSLLLAPAFPGGSSFLLFKSVEDIWNQGPQLLASDLLRGPWERVGCGPMLISDPAQ